MLVTTTPQHNKWQLKAEFSTAEDQARRLQVAEADKRQYEYKQEMLQLAVAQVEKQKQR